MGEPEGDDDGTDTGPLPDAPGEPLFRLDLGNNGGVLAPTSFQDLRDWVQRETALWGWVSQAGRFGPHDHGFTDAIMSLRHAANELNTAAGSEVLDKPATKAALDQCQNRLRAALLSKGLPHSSTPLAKRVQALRAEAGDPAASYYLSVFVPANTAQPMTMSEFRGLVQGLIDRFNLPDTEPRRQSIEDALAERMRSFDESAAEKKAVIDALHRDYNKIAQLILKESENHANVFATATRNQDKDFQDLLERHRTDMDALRKTHREEIAMRAPVEYWEEKRKSHTVGSWVAGVLSFLGIGAAGVFLADEARQLLTGIAKGASPDTWRIGALALMALFAVWGIRLVVRIFLSQMHLAGDAGERVVMVKTYLSLMEGDRLADKDDRQLILQALFRPAADGIVKDEGVPLSLSEILTRTSKP